MMRLIAPVVLLMAALTLGCQERPRAPALRDEPVFDNPYVGLRFMSPPGWSQAARTDRPPPVEREHLLVRFQSNPGQRPALFEVTMQEVSETASVADMLRGPSHSMGSWTESTAAESVTIGGLPGMRYTLVQRGIIKESVAVRRGKELFVFSVVAPKSEPRLRDQIRQVLQDVTWTK